jgi:flagellar motility protein MotE (MotC chaperone)
MTHLLSNLRLIPIVLVAIICLFALKTFGLVFHGGYTLSAPATRNAVGAEVTGSVAAPAQAPRKRSWAQEMLNFPEVTGSVPSARANAPETTQSAAVAQPAPTVAIPAADRPLSPAERAVLERLAERRAELDARARELDMRESLLMAAEKRLEARVAELKELEARVNNAVQAKSEEEAGRLKNLITMYENMKAKDAARIFDRLDIRVLIEVAIGLNPRRMSDIMAQMMPEAAERLTIELAARAKDKSAIADLPKIEGRPAAN